MKANETLLNALEEKGVKYIELRMFDLNPFEKLSISLNQMYFMQIFLIYCLFEKHHLFVSNENEYIIKNAQLTAVMGRLKDMELFKINNTKIEKVLLNDWAKDIFEKLFYISELMDNGSEENKYTDSVQQEYMKINNMNLLPSDIIMN